jgi:hypothetical protein
VENRVGRPKTEKKFHVLLSMNKKEHDMLVAYAELEKRPKANAALLLVRDSLINLFSGFNQTNTQIK